MPHAAPHFKQNRSITQVGKNKSALLTRALFLCLLFLIAYQYTVVTFSVAHYVERDEIAFLLFDFLCGKSFAVVLIHNHDLPTPTMNLAVS